LPAESPCPDPATLAELVRVVDLQDGVLLHDAEQHQQVQGRERCPATCPVMMIDRSSKGNVSGRDKQPGVKAEP
jgi:hypothetical protein